MLNLGAMGEWLVEASGIACHGLPVEGTASFEDEARLCANGLAARGVADEEPAVRKDEGCRYDI
jgi:hypothetical protein